MCSWIGRLNIVEISSVFKLINRFTAIVIKMPNYFVYTEKSIVKFATKGKGVRIVNPILFKKSERGGISLPNSKNYI